MRTQVVPLWTDPDGRTHVVRLTDPDEIEQIVRLFEHIAEDEGWKPDGALRRWIDHSVYFAVQTDNGELAGGLQLVLSAEGGGLPCQTVWSEVQIPCPASAAHVAILCLDKSFRGKHKHFWPLVAEMWRYCAGEGISTLYLETTERVYPLYRRLGWPIEISGELREHWGEGCYLTQMGVADVAAAMLTRAERSLHYRKVVTQLFRLGPSETCQGRQRNAASPHFEDATSCISP